MRIQLCLSRDYILKDVLNSKFYHKINDIVLNSGQISTFPDKTKSLSALIDYPYGLGNPSVREHEILSAIRGGATSINLVLNNLLISSDEIGPVLTELNTLKLICKERKVKLIPIIEYRTLRSYDILDLCPRLYNNGISSIIIGTGTIVDDITDNLITCQQIVSKVGMEVIPCLYFLSSKQLESFVKIDIKTIRLMSISSVENLFR